MDDLYITFRLTGWHARHFRQMMRIANLNGTANLDESRTAALLLEALLEDDAKSHGMPVPVRT
jgi:hypothetical protein